MTTQAQIKSYIESLPEAKRNDMQALHRIIQQLQPKDRLWFLNGKNDKGRVVSNPNIGYGSYTIRYADKTEKEFYQIGLSAHTTGISVYIMGIKDKKYLVEAYGKNLGKASVTGYCIKFKSLKDINLEILEDVIRFGFKKKIVSFLW
ncbi:MAG: DUF1801 domain-containing protein [Cyclobacteriaceae bacterium]|nr:MAG: DUF1801 domain-containing protein [Cyclobacteriaceae bacterium]